MTENEQRHLRNWLQTELDRYTRTINKPNWPTKRKRASLIASITTKLEPHRKTPCIICGAPAQGHHPDYDRPQDVTWLCPKHHSETHRLGNKLRRQQHEKNEGSNSEQAEASSLRRKTTRARPHQDGIFPDD